MRIDILTGLPELFKGPLDQSIIQRAQERRLVEIHIHNLRDYSTDKHRSIDDYAFGGGAGMVMSIEPIDRAIQYLTGEREYDEIIYTAPEGERYTQKTANSLSTLNNIIILCGHYKGVDQRVRDHLITREISIGDYVMTGGELAASVIVDTTVRLMPGVINDETSALTDSYQDDILAPSVYTRPSKYKGWKVPEVLLSGNFPEIEKWREQEALRRTKKYRPDLLGGDDRLQGDEG